MLNLKGQAEKSHGEIDPSHQARLQQAFATVLVDQVAQGQAEKIAKLSRHVGKNDNNDDELASVNHDDESSDIDFDDMDAELDRIQETRRIQVCFYFFGCQKIQHVLFFSPFPLHYSNRVSLFDCMFVLRVSPHYRRLSMTNGYESRARFLTSLTTLILCALVIILRLLILPLPQITFPDQIAKVNEELNEWRAKGHGVYDITIQSEFLPVVTTTQYCVIHFFHKAFERCKIIGKHLNVLAPMYYPVRFLSIDAEKAPFFVEKLQITILPTLVLFKDGVAVDRVTGFSDLGNRDDFTTAQLEERLKQSGIMKKLAFHYTEAERLEEDEKRNKQGRGAVFRAGLNHGADTETNADELTEP